MKSALALGSAALLKPAVSEGVPASGAAQPPADPLVGKKWPGWQPGHFQFHTIYTGVAESIFVIYPDGTSMLLDCGDHAAINRGDLAVHVLPNGNRRAGEWIARYVERVNPSKRAVDYMVLSHFHSDHSGCLTCHAGIHNHVPLSGFGQAMQTLSFKKAIDRGYPDYNDPMPYHDGERMGSMTLMELVYRTLKRRDGLTVEKARLGASDQFLPLKDPSRCKDFSVKTVAMNGKIAMPDGTIRDVLAKYPKEQLHDLIGENGLSICQLFTYGKFKLLTTGDFSERLPAPKGKMYSLEDDLADAMSPVDVAKIPHHGHRSGARKLAAALTPRVWLSCVWDQLHNTADTMENLHRGYTGERLYCPGIFPAERRWADKDTPWIKDIAPECFSGTHVIIDVPPGGETYSVNFLVARDESMTVKGVRHFRSRG